MKKLTSKLLGLAFVLLALGFVSSCDKQSTEQDVQSQDLKIEGMDTECVNSLTYMREEEKLAHDVYVNMFEIWSVPVFNNISKSEAHHTNMVKGLLDFYGMDDPALPGIGEFSNTDLQELYTSLINIGNASLTDALVVGATIEEIDIIDLRDAIENCTEDTIIATYSRLKRASGFHLKAFVAHLAFHDYTYTPQYLTQEEFDEIINGNNTGGGGCDTTIMNLNTEEEESLIFMREEEKLAHDIYINMYQSYNIPVFLNISKSEAIHINKIKFQLNRHSIEDPALPGIGEFSNSNLQDLYNQLLIQGNDSVVAALMVGAEIEERDILDLLTYMEIVENPSLMLTYKFLEKGSEAHLRAFVTHLGFHGIDYTPQFISEELFNQIMGN